MPRDDSSENEARAEIDATEQAAAAAETASKFDIRRVIGGLFLLYAIVLIVVGLSSSTSDFKKSEGVNVNLWTGLGMLLVGLLMVGWALARPLGEELRRNAADTGEGA